MRSSSSFLCIALTLFATAQCVVVPKAHVVHEKRAVTPSRWVKRERLSPAVILPMRIGLKQKNLHRGYDLLMDVSHPDSVNYAKHWTSHEVIEMFSPDQKSVDSVRQWLADFGIDNTRIIHSDNKGWLAFDATTDEVEDLLHTEYHLYEHESGHVTPACESYHVPGYIQEHIDYITPGIKLFAPTKSPLERRSFDVVSFQSSKGSGRSLKKRVPQSLANCDVAVTPACIRALYGIPETPEYPDGEPRYDNSLGIFEAGEEYAQRDLDLFFANFTPNIPQGTAPIPALIDGSIASTDVAHADGEPELDFEIAYPLIYPQTITVFQAPGFNNMLDAIDGSYCNYTAFGETGDDPVQDGYTPNGQHQCGLYTPTNVISISYSGQEADLPPSYQERQCMEFMKLGLQGISVIFSSGDNGVAGHPGDDSDNGCLGDNGSIFSPSWPNNCPYVTSVGATQIDPGSTVYDPESAAYDANYNFTSGGGFSNIYTQPTYQQEAVAAYLKQYPPSSPSYDGIANFGQDGGVYNRLGRGYPDISATGRSLAIFTQGNLTLLDGTSASAPLFASLITRINEQRLNHGKAPLGFLNPAMYAYPQMFNDVVKGGNQGCGAGFETARGWDPVTGLGTPRYESMLSIFMSLP